LPISNHRCLRRPNYCLRQSSSTSASSQSTMARTEKRLVSIDL
jgi:biotin synthase-related radical SAM superfamily protein